MTFTTLKAGIRLAQYEVLEPLGAGGMGEVYRAHDPRLARDVAIKVLPTHLAADPQMRGRFEREARAVAALSHPNILAIYELAVSGDLSFAVMELLEGESLRQRLVRGSLPWRRAVDLAAQTADGLAAAHARGIVHRDVKPENLFLVEGDRVKILDFGLARSSGELDAAVTVDVVTESGSVLGSMGYMAPEQLRAETIGPAVDVFALGCVLFEMLDGRRAFVRPTTTETVAAVLSGPLPSLEPSPERPPTLNRIVTHCLARSPEQRFRSMRDLSTALRALLADSSLSSSSGRPRRGRPAARSIAVLPLANDGGPDSDYLAEGIAESIINALSQLPGLRVVPRSTVFQYRGRELDLAGVALSLNVRTILTGRLTRRGDGLTIQVELIDALNESQLWGEQYRYSMSDLLAAQDEIAWHISEALRIRLTAPERRKLKRRTTTNNEAYQELLRGRYHWGKWTAEGFTRAQECFERAIDRDPSFAAAWAGLGDVLAVTAFYGFQPSQVALRRAKTAARRAIELDAELADAHATLGIVLLLHEWDFAGAEVSARRAVQLNPRSATSHAYLALVCSARGQHEVAVAEARRGLEIDPLSLLMNQVLSWAYFFAGRPQDALAQAHQTLELDPGFAEARAMLVASLELLGQYEQAADEFAGGGICAILPTGQTETFRAALQGGGSRGYWKARLDAARRMAVERPGTTLMAELIPLVQLGRVDEALAVAERMLDRRDPIVPFLSVEPYLQGILGEPRFAALIGRIERGAASAARDAEPPPS